MNCSGDNYVRDFTCLRAATQSNRFIHDMAKVSKIIEIITSTGGIFSFWSNLSNYSDVPKMIKKQWNKKAGVRSHQS